MSAADTAERPVDTLSTRELADLLERQIAQMEGAGRTHMAVPLTTMRKLVELARVRRP